MVYVQLSSGFKSGGFSIASCGDGFKPEQLRSVEVGAKTTLLEGRIRLNAAAFAYDYSDLQVEQVIIPSVVVHNADARVRGAELESSALVWGGLEASLNGTYLHGRYTRFSNSDNTEALAGAPEQDLEGNWINRSPTFSGTFSLQLPYDMEPSGVLTMRAEVNYSTKYYLREFNNATDVQDSHAIYNTYLTWRSPGGHWTARAYGKNLSDEPVLSALIGVAGYKAATFEPPRTLGVSLSYEWF